MTTIATNDIELTEATTRTILALAGVTDKFVRALLEDTPPQGVEPTYRECHRLSLSVCKALDLDSSAIYDDEELESQDDMLTLITNVEVFLRTHPMPYDRATALMRGYVSALFSLGRHVGVSLTPAQQ